MLTPAQLKYQLHSPGTFSSSVTVSLRTLAGSITCAAYPLSQIDTIDIETGNISKNSALNLVVFGEKDEHLELMDGVLVDLLHAKWNAFVKNRFYRQFFLFFLYFLISLLCFTLRPGPPSANPVEDVSPSPSTNVTDDAANITDTTTAAWEPSTDVTPINKLENLSLTTVIDLKVPDLKDLANSNIDGSNRDEGRRFCIDGLVKGPCTPDVSGVMKGKSKSQEPHGFNSSFFRTRGRVEIWWEDWGKCRLLQTNTNSDMIRLAAEIGLEVGAVLYILAALREARFLGYSMFVENLMTAPSRVMFLFSCVLMLTMPFFRFSCNEEVEDVIAVVIMLTTAPYFLFFCRGFKTVGPFVVMIYRMIMGDLLRFASIYLVFVMGFAQTYYIIFLSFDNPNTPEGVDDTLSNPIPHPVEAVMAMFFMSMTSFGDYYPALERTDHEFNGKLCFVIYMVIVAILLVNMLIAMMGNTYQKIAETRNEWQRQWARIVLVVERGVSPKERLTKLMWYSQPMSDGRRALVLRLNQSEEDKEEMKEILEMKRVHNRMGAKMRQRDEKEKAEREAAQPPPPATPGKLQSSTNLIDLSSPGVVNEKKSNNLINLG
ncbi:Transient receptor potential cation channel subfamily V member [Nesidiocoris tenuis]|uniref:Transient receptor potential cation channel subfamily V member n=1 Tax=Nesidiocoris tenuis TaxID=355587 RepID=A0ABN7AN74_9HEMI|nr:Transient receptor potential cation channel subfamily V member [Nesidiocoris tenuis]